MIKNTVPADKVKAGELAIDAIFTEFAAAQIKQPGWPDDIIHATAIMAEESGEAVQAAIDCYYNNKDVSHLYSELAQTAAMCLRAMIYLPIEKD